MRFWDASGVSLKPLYKLSTANIFQTDCDHSDSMTQAGEEEWPPFKKVRVQLQPSLSAETSTDAISVMCILLDQCLMWHAGFIEEVCLSIWYLSAVLVLMHFPKDTAEGTIIQSFVSKQHTYIGGLMASYLKPHTTYFLHPANPHTQLFSLI